MSAMHPEQPKIVEVGGLIFSPHLFLERENG